MTDDSEQRTDDRCRRHRSIGNPTWSVSGMWGMANNIPEHPGGVPHTVAMEAPRCGADVGRRQDPTLRYRSKWGYRKNNHFVVDIAELNKAIMTIDVRIMGVESRMDNIRQTQTSLGIPDSRVFIDTERRGVIWNAKRAWLYPTDATHILVLQDDIELCDGFMDICQRIVEAQPDKVISLFPFQFLREDSLLCGTVDKLPSPYVKALPVSGQGIIIPTKYVEECMAAFPIYFVKRYYDTAIQEWAKSAEVQCITTLPAILQHIGDDSEIYRGAAPRRTAFYEQNPINVNWESRVVLPWRDVYKELPLSDISLNLEIADTVIELRTKGVERLLHGFFSQFIPEKPAAAILEVTDEWDPGNYRENFRLRVAEFLLERNILSLYARAVMVNDRGYLLVGDSKKVKEAAFRLKEQYKDECVVATGNAVCLMMSDAELTAYPTPFTDRYPWEQKQHIRIQQIILLDSRSGETANSEQRTGEMSIKEAFDALVHQLVLPEGVALKLKALSLVGDLAKFPKIINHRLQDYTDLQSYQQSDFIWRLLKITSAQ